MLMHLSLGFLLALVSSCMSSQELTVDEILDNIEKVDISSLTASVSYTSTDLKTKKRTIRTGRLLFSEDENDKKEVAILFDTLIKGRRKKNKLKHIIISGRWLAEIDHDDKEFIKLELVAPGEKNPNPFELDNFPFPFPIGQTKKSILSKYEAEIVEKPKEGTLSKLKGNVVGLKLIPKRKGKTESIELFYNPEIWIPVGVHTNETGSREKVGLLTNIQLDSLSKEDAKLINIETPDPTEWSIDIRPWVD